MNVCCDIPDGLHRCRIRHAKKDVSKKSGNEMIVLTIEAYGYDRWITHYVVFNPSRPDMASRQIGSIFDSAESIRDEFDLKKWAGAECACVIAHKEFCGDYSPVVESFVPECEAESLPHFPEANSGKVFVYSTVCGEA